MSKSSSTQDIHDAEVKHSIFKIQDKLDNLSQLEHEHRQRLKLVEDEYDQLTKFRDDYLHLQKRLKTLPDKTCHEVMVPFGPLAFMPGRLIHTNEILVLLGDNWFVERSSKEAIEIVKRRVRDCNEKIKTAESTKNIHQNFLKETKNLLQDKQQVEIIEELTEEEFENSKKEHRKKVEEHYKKKALEKNDVEQHSSEDLVVASEKNFRSKLNESDKEAYENLMKRLDELEMEEDRESYDSQEEDEEMYEEENPESEGLEENCGSERKLDGAEMEVVESVDKGETSDRPKKLKRRVSWADDKRPLHTVIPDDESEDTYRIKYTTKQMSLPVMEWDGSQEVTEEMDDGSEGSSVVPVVQSPSDLYKMFSGERRCSLPDPPAKGILKKTYSNPESQSSAHITFSDQSGFVMDEDSLDDEHLLSRRLATAKDVDSIGPAFTYKVVERNIGVDEVEPPPTPATSQAVVDDDAPPKRISKFKASRMKK